MVLAEWFHIVQLEFPSLGLFVCFAYLVYDIIRCTGGECLQFFEDILLSLSSVLI